MGLKVVKYVKIDDQKGILYSAGKRSLLIPVSTIRGIDSIFVQLVGKEGADLLIYKIGEGLGGEYARNLEFILEKEEVKIGLETKLKEGYDALFMEAGWGRVEIQKMDIARKILEIKMSYTPSGEFLKKRGYNLERGVVAGIWKEIMKEEVYCQLLKEDQKEHSVILGIQKEIPEKIKEKTRLVLLTRKELEEKIEETTRALREKVAELEKFYRLTVGRELRMRELKDEIKRLKEELKKQKEIKETTP